MTLLEKEVMKLLLDGADPALAVLRQQLEYIKVAKRENTGVGFYTKFTIQERAPRLGEGKSFKFGDVVAEIEGLKHGAGFLLFITDGALDELEGYCYDEAWPKEVIGFKLAYFGGSERDMKSLKDIIGT
jgi:hypothetical protein